MKIEKGSQANLFDLKDISFNDITIIKKALSEVARQGSTHAAGVLKQLSDAINNAVI